VKGNGREVRGRVLGGGKKSKNLTQRRGKGVVYASQCTEMSCRGQAFSIKKGGGGQRSKPNSLHQSLEGATPRREKKEKKDWRGMSIPNRARRGGLIGNNSRSLREKVQLLAREYNGKKVERKASLGEGSPLNLRGGEESVFFSD